MPGTGSYTLKAIKAQHEPQWLQVLADIVADHLVEETALLSSTDVLVPIPPDPNKYVSRGFAPNEKLAEHLSCRIGLLVYPALLRSPGTSTREATYEELSAEFRVEKQFGIPLLEGPVQDQITQAYDYVLSHISKKERTRVGQPSLDTQYRYPPECVREVLGKSTA